MTLARQQHGLEREFEGLVWSFSIVTNWALGNLGSLGWTECCSVCWWWNAVGCSRELTLLGSVRSDFVRSFLTPPTCTHTKPLCIGDGPEPELKSERTHALHPRVLQCFAKCLDPNGDLGSFLFLLHIQVFFWPVFPFHLSLSSFSKEDLLPVSTLTSNSWYNNHPSRV